MGKIKDFEINVINKLYEVDLEIPAEDAKTAFGPWEGR